MYIILIVLVILLLPFSQKGRTDFCGSSAFYSRYCRRRFQWRDVGSFFQVKNHLPPYIFLHPSLFSAHSFAYIYKQKMIKRLFTNTDQVRELSYISLSITANYVYFSFRCSLMMFFIFSLKLSSFIYYKPILDEYKYRLFSFTRMIHALYIQ